MQPNLQTLSLLSLALTPAAPYVTAMLTQSRLPRWANEIIAFLVCLLAGLVAFWQSGGTITSLHSGAALYASVGAIFTGAKLFYMKLGWKSPLLMNLKQIGVTTSPPPAASSFPPFSLPATPEPAPANKTAVMTQDDLAAPPPVATPLPTEPVRETTPEPITIPEPILPPLAPANI